VLIVIARFLTLLVFCAALLASDAVAQSREAEPLPLIERLTPNVVQTIFPSATRVEMVNDDGPVAAAAFRGPSAAFRRGDANISIVRRRGPHYSGQCTMRHVI
jgi:hypothetical protein